VGIPVFGDSGIVDRKKAERVEVVDPHRVGVG
jgi:hypothetical protein